MSFLSQSIPCSQCGRDNSISVKSIEPEMYCDPTRAILTKSYWCSHCGAYQVVMLRFMRDLETREVKIADDWKFLQSKNAPTKEEDKGLTVRCRQKRPVRAAEN